MAGSTCVAMKVVVCMVVAVVVTRSMGPWVEAASCESYTEKLRDCQAYVTGQVDEVGSKCCEEMKRLNDETKGDTPLRRDICKCFSQYVAVLDEKRVQMLPRACKIDLGYTISKSTDCNAIT